MTGHVGGRGGRLGAAMKQVDEAGLSGECMAGDGQLLVQ
jgi:hypothetical protein